MGNQKLRKIGRKLDLTAEQIRTIRKAGVLNKLWYWVIGAAVAILTFIIGFFVGSGSCPVCENGGGSGLPSGYPYAVMVLPGMMKGKKARSKIAILLVSALAFLVAMKASAVFGQAIKYNVYKK